MCGIVGMTGKGPVVSRLIEGLERLEYRGYDSAGVAVVRGNTLECRKEAGRIQALKEKIKNHPMEGMTGIGHTRWATHGAPTEENSHPHQTDRVALVHNGIIENYAVLKEELLGQGCVFKSQTDTEVIVHLIDQQLKQGDSPLEAVQKTLKRLEGAFALGIIFSHDPHLLIGARRGSPLVVGYGEGEMYLGSDAMALASLSQRISYLEEGDLCLLRPEGGLFYDAQGQKVERLIQQSGVSVEAVDKKGYEHFMLKEIHEQPEALMATLQTFLDEKGKIKLPFSPIDLAKIQRVTLVACGTSYYAAMVGKYWLETLARIPAEVDIASEFRYRRPPLEEAGLTIFISQSGETADTLAAVTHGQQEKQKILSIVNVGSSSLARVSDSFLLTQAGPEIGVASTKAFTSQLMALAVLTLQVARAKGFLRAEEEGSFVSDLRSLPFHLEWILQRKKTLEEISQKLSSASHALFLGRGIHYPLALEGALKLKEISYIHAEGYAAGEMKHGPIALIDETMPVVMIAPFDGLYEKTMSNLQEVMARGGKIFLITDRVGLSHLSDSMVRSFLGVFEIPSISPITAPFLTALPLQLLAYYTALLKGTDVDKPRNLAKSVTVE